MIDQGQADATNCFACPHCGTRYEVSLFALPAVEINSAKCESCGQKMADWISKEGKVFHLISVPAQLADAHRRPTLQSGEAI